jgi:hypothetical protein
MDHSSIGQQRVISGCDRELGDPLRPPVTCMSNRVELPLLCDVGAIGEFQQKRFLVQKGLQLLFDRFAMTRLFLARKVGK